MSRRARFLEREVAVLRQREQLLAEQVRQLCERRAVPGELASEADTPGPDRFGPVIHVYLVNGQDFYGVVNFMDEESFSITLSNTSGRVLVIPKRNILYYRMKY